MQHGNDRSSRARRNVILSFASKAVSIICSLLIVPVTIDYLNPERYGIWLTLSSIIGWIAFFDLGLGNGFRNRFAEARARGDENMAAAYVSTAYFTIGAFMMVLLLLILAVNVFLDWPALLHLDASYAVELRKVFAILSAFFCINLVANLFSMLLSADQRNGLSSVIAASGQVISLVVIFLLTKCTEGSLLNMSMYYAGIPCIVMLTASALAFRFTSYRRYRPRPSLFSFRLVGDIMGKGIQFFVICIAALAIFQVSNIILSRETGPESVTGYNVTSKYFMMLSMAMTIIITPYWSAFTEAYTQRDFKWMKSTLRRLELTWLVAVGCAAAMLALSPLFFHIWLKDKVEVPMALSLAVAAYVLCKSLGDIYMYVVNGIGTIRLQLVVYIVLALLAWPCMIWSCRQFGVAGICLYPALASLVQALFCRIQIGKIIGGRASGIWIR